MKRQFGGLMVLFMVVGLTIGIAHAADIDSNLVAYWSLNGDVNDTVGGHNGSLVGGASFVQDAARGAVLRDAGLASHLRRWRNRAGCAPARPGRGASGR